MRWLVAIAVLCVGCSPAWPSTAHPIEREPVTRVAEAYAEVIGKDVSTECAQWAREHVDTAVVDAQEFEQYCTVTCLPESYDPEECHRKGRTCLHTGCPDRHTRAGQAILAGWCEESHAVVMHESLGKRGRRNAIVHELLHAYALCADGSDDWHHRRDLLWCDGGSVIQQAGGEEMECQIK